MPHRRSPAARYRRTQQWLQRIGDMDRLLAHDPSLKILKTWVLPHYDQRSRKLLLERIGRCSVCGGTDRNALELHHRDGHHDHNAWANIMVVCAPCHRRIHQEMALSNASEVQTV